MLDSNSLYFIFKNIGWVEVEEGKRCYCSEAVNAAGGGVAEAAACFASVEPFDIGNGCPYSWDVAGVA